MGRREYDQPCSFACALDEIGERWSLLVVRELLLGPLRFSELAKAGGGAPTDVLTRRLRSLEESGVVRRVELGPPTSATAYELAELGRGLERPLLDLGRFLESRGRAGVPLYLWYAPGKEAEELPQILTPSMLISRARQDRR